MLCIIWTIKHVAVFYIVHNNLNETTTPKVEFTDIPSFDDVCYLTTYSCCRSLWITRRIFTGVRSWKPMLIIDARQLHGWQTLCVTTVLFLELWGRLLGTTSLTNLCHHYYQQGAGVIHVTISRTSLGVMFSSRFVIF